MNHRFQRAAGDAESLAAASAREEHGTIGGLDAETYLEMTRQLAYGRGFLPYRTVVSEMPRILGGSTIHVAELGCGPGMLAKLMLDGVSAIRMTCVDLSPDMLAVASRELEAYADGGRLRFLQEDLQRSLSPRDVHVAIFKGAAHHLTDLGAALTNIRATLASRSVLLLQDYRREGDLRTLPPSIENLLRLPGDHFSIYTRILGYVDSRRVSYSSEELVDAVRRAGLTLVAAFTSPEDVLAVACLGLGDDEQAALADVVGEAFSIVGFRPWEESEG